MGFSPCSDYVRYLTILYSTMRSVFGPGLTSVRGVYIPEVVHAETELVLVQGRSTLGIANSCTQFSLFGIFGK